MLSLTGYTSPFILIVCYNMLMGAIYMQRYYLYAWTYKA